MADSIKTDSLSADERLAEIAEILATGLVRLWARKSSQMSAQNGEFSLDISATQSGHPTPVNRRMLDG
jgi:hypothetical protein